MSRQNLHFVLVALALLVAGLLVLLRADLGVPRADTGRHVPSNGSPAEVLTKRTVPPGEGSSPSVPAAERVTLEDGGTVTVPRDEPVEHYDGPETLRGQVLLGTSPVADALVLCRPISHRYITERHVDRHRARSGSQGRFVIERVPSSTHYEIYAASREGLLGKAYVRRRESSEIVVRVSAASYDRFAYFDEEGRPLAVQELGFCPARAIVVHQSLWPPSPMQVELLREAGISTLSVATNELFAIYAQGTTSRSHTHRIPGFLAYQIEGPSRPLAQWPSSRRVVLHADLDSDLIEHVVAFPEIVAPPLWPPEKRDLVLMVEVDGITRVLTSKSPRFMAKPGARVTVKQRGFEPFDVATRWQDDHELLTPHYPKFAFVTLRRRSGDEGTLSVRVSLRGHFPVKAVVVHHRLALLGPLPVGRYQLAAEIMSTDGSRRVVEMEPFEAAEGDNVLFWD